MSGLTLDTGALVALERRDEPALALIAAAQRREWPVVVPSAVLVEWWRGQRGPAAHLLDAFRVEPLRAALAEVAGIALGRLSRRSKRRRASAVDAVVMASAASRGDVVLTSDRDDLEALRAVFPDVRLLVL